MYTYGYIREATQAHIDLDEVETAAMNLQARYHIYANEAMQAICGVKPKYDYFKATAVPFYNKLIRLGNNEYRKATNEELNWEIHGLPEPSFADEISTKLWYEGQNIYLMNTLVKAPDDFIAFADKQAWAILSYVPSPEVFVGNWAPQQHSSQVPATNKMFKYGGNNTLIFTQAGEYLIPYKALWYRFKSGIGDSDELDIPVDILLTIPLYIAAQCLQVDHAQKALAKRAEFETALARCSNTDFLDNVLIPYTY